MLCKAMISAHPPIVFYRNSGWKQELLFQPLLTVGWFCRAPGSDRLEALLRGRRRCRAGRSSVGGSLRRFLGLLLLDGAPAGDVLVVLVEGGRKDVAAGAVGDEIEVLG